MGFGDVILDFIVYVGEFVDIWFGILLIIIKVDILCIVFEKMFMLIGLLEFFEDYIFVICWDN